jgi:hypothetical protein
MPSAGFLFSIYIFGRKKMKVHQKVNPWILFVIGSFLAIICTGCSQQDFTSAPPTTVIFNKAGEYTWNVPGGVLYVDVYLESCAGGGGGGGAKDHTHTHGSTQSGSGGNGGSGCYLYAQRIYVGNLPSIKVVCPSSGAGGQTSSTAGWGGGGGAGGGAGGDSVFGTLVLPGGTGGGGGDGAGDGAGNGGNGGFTADGSSGGNMGNSNSHNAASSSGIGASYNTNVAAGLGGVGQSASGSSGESVFKGATPIWGICSWRNGGSGGAGVNADNATGNAGASGAGGDGLVMIVY